LKARLTTLPSSFDSMSASKEMGKSVAATITLICPHPFYKIADIASKKLLR
jgi:hypothetical protein